MKLDIHRLNDQFRSIRQRHWVGYLSAIVLVAFALGVRLRLQPLFQGFPFLTFIPTIVVIAVICGWRAGVLAALLGGVASWQFLFPPSFFNTPGLLIGMTFYSLTSLIVISLAAAMHFVLDELQASDRHRQQINVELEHRVRERTAELEESNRCLLTEMHSRVQAEAQVRQLQKMEAVGQLTGGIAHDFNNMLAIIIGSLDLARRGMQRDEREEVLRALQRATKGAQRAADLTARLLAFSRQAPLEPKVVDANALLAGMSELLGTTLGAGIRVETALGDHVWPLFADALQLENAIINLCVNSRDAMPSGGRLILSTASTSFAELADAVHAGKDQHPGDYVVIGISDTGKGMSPEIKARAFDPFFTTKETGKGSGLGLSQVYGFVRQSGGHVRLHSVPGEGTLVQLYLPRHIGELVDQPAPMPTPAAAEKQTAGNVVLVVDDEADVRAIAAVALREEGYDVIEASDARHALSLLAANDSIDLLLTDVVMPDMSGRALADQAMARWPRLKVVFMSGYDQQAAMNEGNLAPGASLLKKPFTLDELASRVRAALI